MANFRHPDYVHLVCSTLAELSQAFAELNQQRVTGSNPLRRNTEISRCGATSGLGLKIPTSTPTHPVMY